MGRSFTCEKITRTMKVRSTGHLRLSLHRLLLKGEIWGVAALPSEARSVHLIASVWSLVEAHAAMCVKRAEELFIFAHRSMISTI